MINWLKTKMIYIRIAAILAFIGWIAHLSGTFTGFTIGAVAGLFFGPLGVIIGPFLGMIIQTIF